MAKEILYTVAKDLNGQISTAKLADKEISYFCLQCNGELILRRSGKSGKNSKRPHFAHKTLTPNCTPETALHFSFKTLLAEKIKKHIELNIELPFCWNCNECAEIHSGDLSKIAKAVIVEYNMTAVQPDLALLNEAEKVIIVIEVIVTHKAEPRAVQFYKDNNIIVMEIVLNSDDDIDNLDKKIANPDHVGACRNPKCHSCERGMRKTMMTIAEGSCWKCDMPMKLAFYEKAGSTLGLGVFNKTELEFARSKGVIIKEHYSRTTETKYLANTCKCGAFIGDHYLFSDYASLAGYGHIPSVEYQVGYHCEICSGS